MTTIKVSIVSDVACPWCYIGIKEISTAIDKLHLPPDTDVKFDIEHRPYFLNPSIQEDETHRTSEYIRERLGIERWQKALQVLQGRGRDLGITIQSDGIVCNTLKAHRLLLFAWNKGGTVQQKKLLEVLFEASFSRGENLGDLNTLAGYAEQCGIMSRAEAVAFLKSDGLKTEVENMVSCARRTGVTGVPFTVINGRWAISGGQTADVFYKIFEKLAHGQDPDQAK